MSDGSAQVRFARLPFNGESLMRKEVANSLPEKRPRPEFKLSPSNDRPGFLIPVDERFPSINSPLRRSTHSFLHFAFVPVLMVMLFSCNPFPLTCPELLPWPILESAVGTLARQARSSHRRLCLQPNHVAHQVARRR